MWMRLKKNRDVETLINIETGTRIKAYGNEFDFYKLELVHSEKIGCYILESSEDGEEIKRSFEKIADEFKNKGELIDLR